MNGVEDLRRGVPSKIADARSPFVDSLRQFNRRPRLFFSDVFPVVPVLAEKTVEGAAVIENRQILVSVFSALRIGKAGKADAGPAGADPGANTVGRQGVVVPRKKAELG